MKSTERQDGLRWRVTLTAETDDDIEALVARLPHCTFEGRLELAERLARRVLADAGLPTTCGTFKRYADGGIERVADDIEHVVFDHIIARDQDGKGISVPDPDRWELIGLTELAGPAPSINHDAAMVLAFAESVRRSMAEATAPAELARRAMRLTEAIEALRLSVANVWRLAETGHKVGDPSRKHRGPREKLPEIAAAMTATIAKARSEPHKPGTEIAAAILKDQKHRDAGVSLRTVRGWVTEERKKDRPA